MFSAHFRNKSNTKPVAIAERELLRTVLSIFMNMNMNLEQMMDYMTIRSSDISPIIK